MGRLNNHCGTDNLRLLYYSPADYGGLADYAHEQANALTCAGINIEMLSSQAFFTHRPVGYRANPSLGRFGKNGNQTPLLRKIDATRNLLRNFRILAQTILQENYKQILMGSYAEYLSPLWAWRLRASARQGVVFGAVVHDPVRDFVLGPRWWHRHSVATAYSFLREAFVHEAVQLDTVRPVPGLRTSFIPHGPYRFPSGSETAERMRSRFRIPSDAFVALSFGHIRDGKNLDLVIQAMAGFPKVWLVVAGKEQSSGQKPVAYYQTLARNIGVESRCCWVNQHIPAGEVGNYFALADLVLLTYSRNFRSASGVLNAAVSYRKPCLASSGGGNIRSVVNDYKLGWFIEPDSLDAIKHGLTAASSSHLETQWDAYIRENSWEKNAQIVKERMFEGGGNSPNPKRD